MKNRKALALGGLLMAVAVTAYSVSGTYAKYISTIGGTDKARVAKWSFNDGAEEIDLFKESYTGANGKYVQSLGCTGEGDAKVCDDVVAPGTNGLYTFQLNGNATDIISEVNYKVTMKIGGVAKANQLIEVDPIMDNYPAGSYQAIGDKYYYSPIKFALVDNQVTDVNTIDAAEWVTFDELIEELNTSYGFLTAGTTGTTVDGVTTTTIVSGENLEQIFDNAFTTKKTIAWKWDYNDPSDTTLDNTGKENARILSKLDTKLGNAAAEGKDTTVSLTVEFTFEQTQEAPTVVTP